MRKLKKVVCALLAFFVCAASPIAINAGDNDSMMITSSNSGAEEISRSPRSSVLTFQNIYLNAAGASAIGQRVSLGVTVNTSLDYHYTGNYCYGDSANSSISYQTQVYSPEICTYSADIDSISMETNGRTWDYSSSDFDEQTIILPSDRSGHSYTIELYGSRLYDPTVFVTIVGTKWTNCVSPYLSGKFTFTVSIE